MVPALAVARPDVATGVPETALDAGEVPVAFSAATVKLYEVPLVRPVAT